MTEINLQTLNQLKVRQLYYMSIAKRRQYIIYAMRFPIQKLRMTLALLEFALFEDIFVNLRHPNVINR